MALWIGYLATLMAMFRSLIEKALNSHLLPSSYNLQVSNIDNLLSDSSQLKN